MNRLLWIAPAAAALFIACTVSLQEPEGRACDTGHACAPGLECQGGTCVLPDGNGGADSGAQDDAGDTQGSDAGTEEEDAGTNGDDDAGNVQDAGVDAGTDAGTQAPEDGGTQDAGTPLPDGGRDTTWDPPTYDGGFPPNTFFVDPLGDDAQDGHTPATAWKTVAKVNSASLPVGSWVLFKGGGVWYESLAPTRNGGIGAPIFFGAYGSGRPVLDGTGAAGNSALNANGKSWVTFQGFELRNWHNGYQLVYMANTHNVVFDNLYLHDADKGFHASPSAASTDVAIQSCIVRTISGGSFTHGLSVPAGGVNWIVKDSEFSNIEQSCIIEAGDGTVYQGNVFFNCGKLTTSTDKHGLFLRGNNTVVRDNDLFDIAGSCLFITYPGAVIEGNRLSGCSGSGIEWAETATTAGNLTARRNRIWDTPVGITLGSATAQGFRLSNNSIHTTRATGAAATAGVIVKANTDVALENNLVTGGAPTVLSVARTAPIGTYVDRTNVWHTAATGVLPFSWNGNSQTFAQYKTASGQSTSTDADPLIASTTPGNPDFTLQANSPARDFGVTNPASGALTPGCDGAYDHYCGAAPEAGAVERLSP